MPSAPIHQRIVGNNVRSYRKRAKFTQEKLAEKSGLSVVYLSLLENGHRNASVTSLLDIARALKVKVTDLVQGLD